MYQLNVLSNIISDPTTRYILKEIDLVNQWLSLTPGTRLVTLDGQVVTVINSGYRNPHSGPDISQAMVLINDSIKIGPVECHLHEDNWQRHGHSSDPAYQDVVLHVLRYNSRPKLDIPAVVLPRIEGSTQVCQLSGKRMNQNNAGIIWYYASRRWQERIHRYLPVVNDASKFRDQLLEHSFGLLGTGSNRTYFMELAKYISGLPLQNSTIAEIEATLVEEVDRSGIIWKTGGVRPGSRPTKRYLLGAGLVKFIDDWLCFPAPGRISGAVNQFFSQFCGEGLRTELLGNVFYPAAVAVAINSRQFDLAVDIKNSWDNLKLPYCYGIISRQFGDKLPLVLLKSFSISQGLLAIYRKFCTYKNCEYCPLKE